MHTVNERGNTTTDSRMRINSHSNCTHVHAHTTSQILVCHLTHTHTHKSMKNEREKKNTACTCTGDQHFIGKKNITKAIRKTHGKNESLNQSSLFFLYSTSSSSSMISSNNKKKKLLFRFIFLGPHAFSLLFSLLYLKESRTGGIVGYKEREEKPNWSGWH